MGVLLDQFWCSTVSYRNSSDRQADEMGNQSLAYHLSYMKLCVQNRICWVCSAGSSTEYDELNSRNVRGLPIQKRSRLTGYEYDWTRWSCLAKGSYLWLKWCLQAEEEQLVDGHETSWRPHWSCWTRITGRRQRVIDTFIRGMNQAS